MEPEGSLPRS